MTLPDEVDFSSKGNPLDSNSQWKETLCPRCHGKAERETDTLDTFFESSWYFAAFCAENKDRAIDKEACEKWLPVDCYIGGPEHAVMHLLYARFFTKALKACGYWDLHEPFKGLYTQGMVCHPAYKDKEGLWVDIKEIELRGDKAYNRLGEEVQKIGSEKMSKSKKNGIEPKEYLEKYGPDTIRLFVLSDSPPDKDLDWNDRAFEGVYRYLQRLYDMATTLKGHKDILPNQALEILRHKTIAAVTEDFEAFHFNKAIARIRELSNKLRDLKEINDEEEKITLATIMQLLYPMIPHLSCEILSILDFDPIWPTFEQKFLEEDKITIIVQVQGKLRGTLNLQRDASEEEVVKLALELETVQRSLQGQGIKRSIFVANRLVNLLP